MTQYGFVVDTKSKILKINNEEIPLSVLDRGDYKIQLVFLFIKRFVEQIFLIFFSLKTINIYMKKASCYVTSKNIESEFSAVF